MAVAKVWKKPLQNSNVVHIISLLSFGIRRIDIKAKFKEDWEFAVHNLPA